MSRYVDVQASGPIGIDEAVEKLRLLSRLDPEFVQKSAEVLHGLYLNQDLLADVVRAELRNAAENRTVFYSPQSFVLGQGNFNDGSTFTLRGNLWFPPSLHGESQRLEDYVYSYDNCHDHNFEFLTIGYSGPGYRTDLFECVRHDVVGTSGERVQLNSLGEAQLSPGRVLHFRKCMDVHVQKHPDDLSVSINLLMSDPDLHYTTQFEFDVDAQSVSKSIYSSSMHYASYAYLAGELGARDVANAAYDQLAASPMWQHRHAAGRAMLLTGQAAPEQLDAALNLPKGLSVLADLSY